MAFSWGESLAWDRAGPACVGFFTAAAGCLPRTPACATHFMPDGIHTNEKGTALIAKLARRALAETCIVMGECIPESRQGYQVCKPCVPVIS